mmetsp:Transcript_147981/g.258019  ORF Transcript_147981/g.258019 Transcript_147981/m.258019 type:complete len:362 (-) Transcript_147981:70-1155(-)
MEPRDQGRAASSPATWCIFYAMGIIVLLGIYGILQERIMANSYGGEFFEFSAFLVFCNRMVAVFYAMTMAIFRGEPLVNSVPLWKYAVVSLSNVLATCCQYEALKWVSFPVQMLGKSFKMMPVMLWGILIAKKRYTFFDWMVASCVTGGVTFFLLTGPITASHRVAGNSAFGLLLLVAFLACDGLTSTMQEKLFRDNVTSKYNQMMYVNILSSIVSMGIIICTGTLLPSIDFCIRHPNFVLNAFELSISAVAGQWFIFSQVKEFGALVLAATMNVRQVNSTVISYMEYKNKITLPQVLGLLVVFGALFYKSYVGFTAPKKDERRALVKKPPVQKQQQEPEIASGADPHAWLHAAPQKTPAV